MADENENTEPKVEVVSEALTTTPSQPEEGPPLPYSDDIVVIAKTPDEMEVAQKGLIEWVGRKITKLQTEAQEAKTNVELAQTRKWKVAPFKQVLTLAEGRVRYYERMKLALEAGYVIMPDLPAQTFAVRTSKDAPRAQQHDSTWGDQRLPTAKPDNSPAGKGRYVSPKLDYRKWATQQASGNQQITTYHARARGFNEDVDFPMTLVKPQILNESNRAMALNIFDEMGILPVQSGSIERLASTKRTALPARNPDPVVIGRIVRYEGYERFACAFLITWWLDTATL